MREIKQRARLAMSDCYLDRPRNPRIKFPAIGHHCKEGNLRPRVAGNLPRPHGDLSSLQGSLGQMLVVLPSSGPCRSRYRVVSAPPSSALVTVMQPGRDGRRVTH
jgi:hypothetical protein